MSQSVNQGDESVDWQNVWNFDAAFLCFLFSAFVFIFANGSGSCEPRRSHQLCKLNLLLDEVIKACSMRMEKSRHFPRLRLALRCKWKLIHKENRFAAFKLRITFQISANFLPEIAFIDLAFLDFDISIVGVPSLVRASLVAHRRGVGWKYSRQTTRTIVEK